MSCTKLRSSSGPSGVCMTSGWNWIPYNPAPLVIAAIGIVAVEASASNPAGRTSTRSPWLIQTGSGSGSPRSSAEPSARAVTDAEPNSRSRPGATWPPSCCAIVCIP